MINAETCWNRGIVRGLGVIFFLRSFFSFSFFLSRLYWIVDTRVFVGLRGR